MNNNAKESKKGLQTDVWQTPIHPGEIIRRRFFDPLGMTQADFCAKHKIEKSKFSRIINGSLKITAETATELSEALGMSAMFFMNLQSQHDLALAKKKIE
jgi:addiction module HigA family antidote